MRLVAVVTAVVVSAILVWLAIPLVSRPICERAVRHVFTKRVVAHGYYEVDCNGCDAASVMSAVPAVDSVDCYDLWPLGLGNDWDCRVRFEDGSTLEVVSQWWGVSHVIRFQGPPDPAGDSAGASVPGLQSSP